MCPIHDTDSPEERWSQAEWEHYELHEKLEARARRRRRWIVGAAVLAFLGLSAVPVIMDRSPQWLAKRAARELAENFNRLKREAGTRKLALKVSMDPAVPLRLRVDRAAGCDSSEFEFDAEIDLLHGDLRREQLAWLDPEKGREAGVPGLLRSICFDPLKGSSATPENGRVAGWGIVPANELTGTPERYAVIVLAGPSAEISFE